MPKFMQNKNILKILWAAHVTYEDFARGERGAKYFDHIIRHPEAGGMQTRAR